MNLLDLPAEILLLIFQYLDLESIYSMMEISSRTYDLILLLRNLRFKGKDLKPESTLQQPNLQYISKNIIEMDLNGFHFLCERSMLAIKMMTNMKELDVSDTNLVLQEIMNICPPSVKKITMTLSLSDLQLRISSLNYFFKKFDYIHYKCKPLRNSLHVFAILNLLLNITNKEQKIKISCYTHIINPVSIPVNKLLYYENVILDITSYYIKFTSDLTLNDVDKFDFFIYNYNNSFDKQTLNVDLTIISTPFIISILNKPNNYIEINNVQIIEFTNNYFSSNLQGRLIFLVWNKTVFNKDVFEKIILQDIAKNIPSVSIEDKDKNNTNIIKSYYNDNHFHHYFCPIVNRYLTKNINT